MALIRSLKEDGGLRLVGRNGGGSGRVDSVKFDGSTRISVGNNLHLATGPALLAGKVGTFSVFFRPISITTTHNFFQNTGGRFEATIGTTRKPTIFGRRSPDGVTLLSLTSSVAIESSSFKWHHLLASWDLASNRAILYLDGVDRTVITTLVNDGSEIDYARNDWCFGGNLVNIFTNANMYMAEGFFHNRFVDITQEGNRLLFVRADGKPAFMDSGRAPFANLPWFYLSGDATEFRKNRGRGRSFSVNLQGTLLTAESSVPPPQIGV